MAGNTGDHYDIWMANPELAMQWNLYLQAMINFQANPIVPPDSYITQEMSLTYHQIAGIHGLPFVHWLEAQRATDRAGLYCTHGSSLFATWHRPYLLLFEQRIVEEAIKIANKMPSTANESYLVEAQNLRIPYWDWASDTEVPAALSKQTIIIDLPGYDKTPVHNPLYSYKFESLASVGRDFGVLYHGTVLTQFMETKRCPDAWGNSHNETVGLQLGHQIEATKVPGDPVGFREGIYLLLTTVDNYRHFSNTEYQHDKDQSATECQPLEAYHNAIHDYVGSDFSNRDPKRPNYPKILGHMTEVPVSGFDPIFWLHHANIDRLYAMWQTMYYTASFMGDLAQTGRLPAPDEPKDTINTTLRPFYHKDKTNKFVPWTSRDVQQDTPTEPPSLGPSTFDHNYHYPEIPAKANSVQEQQILSNIVWFEVWLLYGPRPSAGSIWSETQPQKPLALVNRDVRYRTEWMITLNVRKYLVQGNFVIFFFLGQPEADPGEWVASPNLAGSYHTFKTKTDVCSNCLSQQEADVKMTGGIHITNELHRKLTDLGHSFTKDRPRIAEWLQTHLQWKILKDDGTDLDLTALKPVDLTVHARSFGMWYPKGLVTASLTTDTRAAFSTIYDPETHLKGVSPGNMDLRLPRGRD